MSPNSNQCKSNDNDNTHYHILSPGYFGNDDHNAVITSSQSDADVEQKPIKTQISHTERKKEEDRRESKNTRTPQCRQTNKIK